MEIMAVRRLGYRRSRARRAWRNWRTAGAWEACRGYNAGERSEGMTTRWTVPGGEESIRCCRFCRIAGKGEVVVRGMGM